MIVGITIDAVDFDTKRIIWILSVLFALRPVLVAMVSNATEVAAPHAAPALSFDFID